MQSDDKMDTVKGTAVVSGPGAQTESGESDFFIETSPEPVSLRDRIAVVRQNYWIILAVCAFSTGLAAYIVANTPSLYRAAATVRFNDMRSNLTSGVGTELAAQMSWAVDPVKTQIELLTSRATAEKAVDDGKLQAQPIGSRETPDWIQSLDAHALRKPDTLRLLFGDSTYSAVFGTTRSAAGYGGPLDVGDVHLTVFKRPAVSAATVLVVPRVDVVERVMSGIKSKRRTETDIADLLFDDTNPAFAQRAINATANAFQVLNALSSQEAARARRVFIDAQLRKTDSLLEIQRLQLSEFRSAAQAFSSKDKIASEQTSLANLRARRDEVQADRQVYSILLNRAQAAISAGDVDGLRSIVASPGLASSSAIGELYSQYAKIRGVRDSLTTGPFPVAATNPDLLRANGLLASTTERLLAAVRSQIETLDARIGALDAMSSRTASAVSSLPQTEAEEARLIQQSEGTEKMAEQLREEQQRSRISEVAQVGQVQIVDLARLPEYPVNGGQSRKIIFAALLGLGLGVGLTLLLDSFDTSLRRISDAETFLRLPTLGAIPELSGAKPKARRLRLPSARLSDVQVNQARSISNEPATTASLRYVNPSAPAFESFRALRTSLIFSNAVKSLRSIVVTSAAAGDGKSTTSTNLAAAFAQQGMRVLIVDCDMRRGRLHAAFDVPRSPGLTEVIIGSSSAADAVHQTVVPNLWLLTVGLQPPNPTELLGSDSVRAILMSLTKAYDLVIIDTPPVLAAADAAVLSAMVDGVIMVVRVGVTDRRAAKRSLERLQIVGSRVLGTVLNDPQEILGTSEDYYYYQYRYSAKKVG
ncbi:MAG: polysaccharide biosynthesis tyrosine autokinase [Gemmatimonadales bacterium]